MVRLAKSLCLLCVCLLSLSNAQAGETYLQASCSLDFPEAMLHLQDSIRRYGYTISRVQHVDKGLEQRGYVTEPYKVIFFGKADELDYLRKNYPAMISFLPLSITILKEGHQTFISTLDPKYISQIASDAKLQEIFHQWQHDFEGILQSYSTCQLNA